ncbi:hypothetical protein KOI35_12545 [Actinoplanes bogorensis]|uniref:Uncharacterized protein n=1 Tax=Paractinoplanes bogorensis TaxID=1610840 RepID=A0ABS5YNK4_9ACTN|nr:hypothetical protein [Actinoplanes bogorensis]MBU2664324.1 hypothetical protein [Actinoplanes bogorensis]
MATLRTVWFWPGTGWADRPWVEAPGEDAFARSANSVSELYSQGVRPAGITNRHSELRLFTRDGGDREDVLVMVHPEENEGFEMAVAELPKGVDRLPAAKRARLVLEVMHGAAVRLGQARGWDPAGLAGAHAHVLAAGLRFRWDGPAKSSPDRRHTAQPSFVLGDDGLGRVVVRVRRREDGSTVCVSPVAAVWGSSRAFADYARTVRWNGSSLVNFGPEDGVVIGADGSSVAGSPYWPITLDLNDPGTFGVEPADTTGPVPDVDGLSADTAGPVPDVDGLPAIVVRTPADLGPRIEIVGGGSRKAIPAAYQQTLSGLLVQLRAPAWRDWWSGADRDLLEIFYEFPDGPARSSVRRGRNAVVATLRRSPATLRDEPDPAAVARRDVVELLDAIRRRAGLGEPPPLI